MPSLPTFLRLEHNWIALTTLALGGALVSGCQGNPLSVYEHQKTILARVTDGDIVSWKASESGNGCRLILVTHDSKGYHVTVDGLHELIFDKVALPYLWEFSPEGKHMVYSALDGGVQKLVLDGASFIDINREPESIRFSPDGQHIAYASRIPKGDQFQYQIVVDGVPGPVFDNVKMPTFSPDNKHLAYIAEMEAKFRVIVDGVPDPEFKYIQSELYFNPDSKRIAYVVSDGEKQRVMYDGNLGPEYKVINNLTFSHDGNIFIYSAGEDYEERLMPDGASGPAFMLFSHLSFSPDNQHLAYVVNYADVQMYLDGKPGPLFAHLDGPNFSPDSKHMAYIGEMGIDAAKKAGDHSGYQLFVDGILVAKHDYIDFLKYSSKNKLVYWADDYIGDQTQSSFYIDGKLYPNYHFGLDMKFSPDGEHIVSESLEKDGKMRVVVDGIAGPAFDAYPRPVFSADSKHVAYEAGTRNDPRVMVDGQLGPVFERILAGPVVRRDGILEYIAVENSSTGRNLVRVTVSGFSPASSDGVIPTPRGEPIP